MKIMALYDQTCSLCKQTKRVFERFDRQYRVDWISLQQYEMGKAPQPFSGKDLRKELHIIMPSGEVLKGYYAVRRLLLQFPATFLIGFLLSIPFSPILGVPVYKWIARNRHKLLRTKCENGSCGLD